MAKLIFIGLGLFDENDISLKGLQELKSCTHIFAEFYTSQLSGFNQQKFEKIIDRKIRILSRIETEQGTCVLDAAKKSKTAFLVCGDPMMATTHIDLRIRAIKQGIQTDIIHNASIITAAPALLGLQNYKFGRTTTLVYPEKNYFPISPYNIISENKNRGLHSLILLDIQSEKNRFMSANEGLNILMDMEKHHNKNIITPHTLVCVAARIGSPHPVLKADTVHSLLSQNFGQPLHSLIIPGNLHFMELEALMVCAALPEKVAKKLQKP